MKKTKSKSIWRNLISRWKNMHFISKISAYFWIMCLVLLFTFIGLVVWHQELTGTDSHKLLAANLTAVTGMFFILSLFTAILITIIPQVVKTSKKRR